MLGYSDHSESIPNTFEFSRQNKEVRFYRWTCRGRVGIMISAVKYGVKGLGMSSSPSLHRGYGEAAYAIFKTVLFTSYRNGLLSFYKGAGL